MESKRHAGIWTGRQSFVPRPIIYVKEKQPGPRSRAAARLCKAIAGQIDHTPQPCAGQICNTNVGRKMRCRSINAEAVQKAGSRIVFDRISEMRCKAQPRSRAAAVFSKMLKGP